MTKNPNREENNLGFGHCLPAGRQGISLGQLEIRLIKNSHLCFLKTKSKN